jgi:hypothetical protein
MGFVLEKRKKNKTTQLAATYVESKLHPLNSRVISYWFAYKFGKLQRGIFPQIKINELAQFPIPNVSSDKQRPIINLVNKILSAKKKNPAADTSTFEQQIDAIVYKLYDITPKEQKIIEQEIEKH